MGLFGDSSSSSSSNQLASEPYAPNVQGDSGLNIAGVAVSGNRNNTSISVQSSDPKTVSRALDTVDKSVAQSLNTVDAFGARSLDTIAASNANQFALAQKAIDSALIAAKTATVSQNEILQASDNANKQAYGLASQLASTPVDGATSAKWPMVIGAILIFPLVIWLLFKPSKKKTTS